MTRVLSTGQERGAATTVYCAVVPDLADFGGGEYFVRCRVTQTAAGGRDLENASKLWTVSEEMIEQFQESKRKTFTEAVEAKGKSTFATIDSEDEETDERVDHEALTAK